MIGINKRYPAYKAKTELRNRMRRTQEEIYYWCHRHKLDIRTKEDHLLHEVVCRHFEG